MRADYLLARGYGGALVFLIVPLGLVKGGLADTIQEDVRAHLMGDYGSRRYLGDSYWCADYKEVFSEDDRTSDFSDDQASRDQYLKPGQEAQWCIFDSIMSVIYGQRFLESRQDADLETQRFHLDRALSQLTTSACPFGT